MLDVNTTFLDLDIHIDNGKFCTKLYDKRRDFNFKVVSLPNLKSNVPKQPSYGIFKGEVYRIYVNLLPILQCLSMTLSY